MPEGQDAEGAVEGGCGGGVAALCALDLSEVFSGAGESMIETRRQGRSGDEEGLREGKDEMRLG